MKSFKFLLFFFLITMNKSLGQCNTEDGIELSQKIDYFKCENGYKAPIGFEWMEPTKVYIKFMHFKSSPTQYSNTPYYGCEPRICNADSLEDANLIYANNSATQRFGYSAFAGAQDNLPNGSHPLSVLCLDCGLGYYAYVVLIDDYFKDGFNYPNQGLGYTCGQPTAEKALKEAWKQARIALNSKAVAFDYVIGVNAKIINKKTTINGGIQSTFISQGSSLKTYNDLNNSYKNYNSTPPDDAEDFLNYVKTFGSKYLSGRKPDLSSLTYSCNFNEINNSNEENSHIIGINNYNFPVFNEPINNHLKTTQRKNITNDKKLNLKPSDAKETNSISKESSINKQEKNNFEGKQSKKDNSINNENYSYENAKKISDEYNNYISQYNNDKDAIKLELNLKKLIFEHPDIFNLDKQFYISYSAVLTTNASKLYDEGKFSDAEKKIRESLKYDSDNVSSNQYLFNILIFKYNDKKIKDVKEIIKELNILIDKLSLIDKDNISQYLEIKNKINK